MTQLETALAARAHASAADAEPSEAWLAARLVDAATRPGSTSPPIASPSSGLIHICRSESRAARLAALAVALDPDAVAWLPAWDCLPYDRSAPSRPVMGQRMAVLGRVAQGHAPLLLILSVDALLQRLPPPECHKSLRLEQGAVLTLHAIENGLRRLGYRFDDMADLPGKAVRHGEIIDILPPNSPLGRRIEYLDGRIAELRLFDPVTQRSLYDTGHLVVPPASEILLPPQASLQDSSAAEHRLPEFYDRLITPFDLLPGAAWSQDHEVRDQIALRLAEITECYQDRLRFGADPVPLPPDRLYLTESEINGFLARLPEAHLADAPGIGTTGIEMDSDAAPSGHARPVLPDGSASTAASVFAPAPLRIGNAVVHREHGLGALLDIETTEIDGLPTDCLRLEYAHGARLLVQVEEADRLWRYGADADSVSLNRLNDPSWPERQAQVEVEIQHAADKLAAMARARRAATAPRLTPDRRRFRTVADRFPFPLTPDQDAAIAAVLHDLKSGTPMDRLVCGDVGFGKTEVALRAAAAAALSGWQVAILAPTTVLARQHLHSVTRRFAGMGITVRGLSRLTPAAEARATRTGLAEGSVHIAVGTHALAARNLRFHRLGLVIIDEEQRFGARQKSALRQLAGRTAAASAGPGQTAHVISMTATPIPRSLQSALVGLQDLSVIATPPRRRRPVRCVTLPFDETTMRAALEHEHRRGGQSFVVAPRIADLPALRARLAALVPDLTLVQAHGKMPPAEVDETMLRFAQGHGDILLATNIIETGLDVPRANTMLIWRADRFGLAQLHQLRGRVGRGETPGTAYLLTDPAKPPGAATLRRLQTLETLGRLGAGFALSARDLDLRGAGDLTGDDQAGHTKLIGIDLYQSLFAAALARAQGTPAPDPWVAEVVLHLPAFLPARYIPEADTRIEFYDRIGRLLREQDMASLAELPAEVADRFGPPPEPVTTLLAITALRAECRRKNIRRLEGGPNAIAATPHAATPHAATPHAHGVQNDGVQNDRVQNDGPPRIAPPLTRHNGRIILTRDGATVGARLRNAAALLAMLPEPAPMSAVSSTT